MSLLRKAALSLLRLFGWSSSLTWPPEPRGLIMVYPHTSNWDFVVGVLFRVGHGLPAQWMGKDTMFRWPVAGLFRRIGGIPINRREPTGLVTTLQAEFRRRDWIWLAVTPEGTRAYTDHLKSGFYRLAVSLDVPIGLAYIDYGRRKVAIDDYVRMSGDEQADLALLAQFYSDKQAYAPALAGALRFRAREG